MTAATDHVAPIADEAVRLLRGHAQVDTYPARLRITAHRRAAEMVPLSEGRALLYAGGARRTIPDTSDPKLIDAAAHLIARDLHARDMWELSTDLMEELHQFRPSASIRQNYSTLIIVCGGRRIALSETSGPDPLLRVMSPVDGESADLMMEDRLPLAPDAATRLLAALSSHLLQGQQAAA